MKKDCFKKKRDDEERKNDQANTAIDDGETKDEVVLMAIDDEYPCCHKMYGHKKDGVRKYQTKKKKVW